MTFGTGRSNSSTGYDHRRLSPNALQQRALGGATLVSVAALCAWTLCSTLADTSPDEINLAGIRGDKLVVVARRGDKLVILKPSVLAANVPISVFDPRSSLGLTTGTFTNSTPLQGDGNLPAATPSPSLAAARNAPDNPPTSSRGERVAQNVVLPMPRPASAPQIAADTPPAKPSIFAAIFEKLFGKPAPVKLAYAATDDGGLGVGQMGAARYDRWAVVAVRDATLSFVSRAAFGDFAKKHPELCQSLLRLLAKRVRERDKMAATSFPSLKGRIAQTLLELAEDFGQEVGPGRIVIRQKIRQTDLAAMAGVARETVTRILNDWQRHKLVSRLSGYYCLENEALLERQVKH
jgi:hypothetical protein